MIEHALLPVPFAAMGLGAVAILFHYIIGTQKRYRSLLNKERMAAIEKGLTLPPEAFIDDEARRFLSRGAGNSLKTGLIILFLGLGTTAALFIDGPRNVWAWGLILVLVGLGHLLYWFVGGREEWQKAQELEELRARGQKASADE